MRSHIVTTLFSHSLPRWLRALRARYSPEIADIGFFQGGDIPADIAFNSMVRVRDALDGCRGVVRVFDSATSLVPKWYDSNHGARLSSVISYCYVRGGGGHLGLRRAG